MLSPKALATSFTTPTAALAADCASRRVLLALMRESRDPRYVPPETLNDTSRQIAPEQGDAIAVTGAESP